MSSGKLLGQYFTPSHIAASLVKWLLRKPSDLLLDPSCGPGIFLQFARNAVGVELSPSVAQAAKEVAPDARIICADFFDWASGKMASYDCVGGNPPFIRYQSFPPSTREKAALLTRKLGVELSGLSSSWAPFILAGANLVRPGGRMAFIVPAEIGHATYAPPVLETLCQAFGRVVVIAVKEKMFPQLSEDTWLLFADDRGKSTNEIELVAWNSFHPTARPPGDGIRIFLDEWRSRGGRLRRYLLPPEVLAEYDRLTADGLTMRLGALASVNIGYVSGDNDFFHLRPSQLDKLGIPQALVRPTVRRSEQLRTLSVDTAIVNQWMGEDLPVLLLDIPAQSSLPPSVAAYLDSEGGRRAQERFKCRTRSPWYRVPDVRVPHAFISCMSGQSPKFVLNNSACVCTNSLHAVCFASRADAQAVLAAWDHPLAQLSQELEGHPLGGGMLKLEPREAARIVLPKTPQPDQSDASLLLEGVRIAKEWRHCETRST